MIYDYCDILITNLKNTQVHSQTLNAFISTLYVVNAFIRYTTDKASNTHIEEPQQLGTCNQQPKLKTKMSTLFYVCINITETSTQGGNI